MYACSLELNGIASIEPEETRKGREQLIYSRSFSHTISTRQEFSHVLSVYTQNAALRLGAHGLQASVMNLWAQTSPSTQHIRHTATCTAGLPVPTADPVLLTKAAQPLLDQLNPEAR